MDAAPFGNKDLAVAMGLTVRSVIRWANKLNVAPTVPGNASNRWSKADRDRLLEMWKAHWDKQRQQRQKKKRK